jgi:hypothetical protein
MVTQSTYDVWLRVRTCLLEIAFACFGVIFLFNVGLYQACMLAERKTPLPQFGRIWPFATKYGVCYYSRGESLVLYNSLYLFIASLTILAILAVAARPIRRYDLSKQQFVSSRDWGQPNWIRFASFGFLFFGIIAFVCWG